MTNKTWWTWLAGLGFLALGIVAIILSGGEPPSASDDSVREIAKYYDDNSDTLMASCFLGTIASVLLVYFGSHLRNTFREASLLGTVIFAGTIVLAVALAVDSAIQFALIDAVDDPDVAIAPGAIQALGLLFDNDFLLFILGICLYGTASGLAIIRHGVIPKWLGWAAIVFGLFVLIPHEIGFIGFIGMFLWTGVVSVYMALQAKKV